MDNLEHATKGIIALIVFILATFYLSVKKAKSDPNAIKIRKIAGVSAIDETIGRSVEMGRPISFCTGLTGMGPLLYASYGVLQYIAEKVAMYKARLLLPQTQPDVMALADERVRTAYTKVGRSHLYDPTNLIYLSDDQFAFASGYIGVINRENVGSAFLFGHFAAESLILSTAGQEVGAMQIAATIDPEQVAFFICTCDYTLIGEEIFAASAFLQRDPSEVGSIRAQDIIKGLFFVLIVIGIICSTITAFNPDFSYDPLSIFTS